MKVNGDPPANDMTRAEGAVARGSLCATDSSARTATTTAVRKASGACAGVIYEILGGKPRCSRRGGTPSMKISDSHREIRKHLHRLSASCPSGPPSMGSCGSSCHHLVTVFVIPL